MLSCLPIFFHFVTEMRNLLIVLACSLCVCVYSKESTQHGIHADDHYDEDGEHDTNYDHQAILGKSFFALQS